MGPGLLAVAGIIMMWMGYTVLSTWFEAKRYAHFKLPRPANWLLGNLLEMDVSIHTMHSFSFLCVFVFLVGVCL